MKQLNRRRIKLYGELSLNIKVMHAMFKDLKLKENLLCDFNLTATLIFQFWIDSKNYFYGKFHTYTKNVV